MQKVVCYLISLYEINCLVSTILLTLISGMLNFIVNCMRKMQDIIYLIIKYKFQIDGY